MNTRPPWWPESDVRRTIGWSGGQNKQSTEPFKTSQAAEAVEMSLGLRLDLFGRHW